MGFPGGSAVKNPPSKAGVVGLSPGLRRSPGVGNGNPLQYSCLGNPMDRGAWLTTVHGVTQLDTSEQLTHTKGMFSALTEMTDDRCTLPEP